MNRLKQYTSWIVGAAALASALGIGAFGIATAARDAGFDREHESRGHYSEDHDSDDHEAGDHDSQDHDSDSMESALVDSGPVDPLYREECGACHVAYPPGLLPSASWKAVMSSLDDHFGENAELPADIAMQLKDFLGKNASDRGDRLKNARLLRDVEEEAPLRITGLPYFEREHDEIPRRMVEGNPGVASFSNCDVCHQDATLGRFDEDTVSIPGFGRWDD